MCSDLRCKLCSRVGVLAGKPTRLHSVWREFVRSLSETDSLQSADDKQDLREGFNFKLHVIIELLFSYDEALMEY